MMDLTFGEQVKIILGRRGMTIKDLAELVEKHTGKPMSRQNMTQKLGRDNFQEQDMRLIAEILECKFTLSIIDETTEMPATTEVEIKAETEAEVEEQQADLQEQQVEEPVKEAPKPSMIVGGFFRRPVAKKATEEVVGEINPYTRKEYESNSVRVHPTKIGYIQVYNQEQHKWNDMTEWAFLANEERRKKTLGKNYRPPIYLD